MRGLGWAGGLGIALVVLCSGELQAQDIRVSATILPRVGVDQLELAWQDLTAAGPLCREGARPVGVNVEVERDGLREPVEACLGGARVQRLNQGSAVAHEVGPAQERLAVGTAPVGERITVWLVTTS